MKLPKRIHLLKILATAAISAFVYVGAVTLRTALFGIDGGFFTLLLFVLIMFLGHLAGGLFFGDAPLFTLRVAGSKFVRFLSFMLYIKVK